MKRMRGIRSVQQCPRRKMTCAWISYCYVKREEPSTTALVLSPVSDGSCSSKHFGKSCHLVLTGSIKLAVEELLNRSVLVKSAEALDNFTLGNTEYKQSDQSDYFIKLKNGCYGKIHLILLLKENCVCTSSCLCQAISVIVVQLFGIKPDRPFSNVSPNNTSKAIFVRAERTEQLKAFLLDDIKSRCVHVDGWRYQSMRS